MKKLLFGMLVAVVLVSGLTAGTVLAADAPLASSAAGSPNVGPFEGVFSGILYGDNNSRAPIALQMTHRDGVVNGRLYLGEGLFVNAAVKTSFNVSGFDIGADLTSTVSADGSTLNAGTSIDLPWICGRDPSYSGTLYRIK
jgi:hypothetical protein